MIWFILSTYVAWTLIYWVAHGMDPVAIIFATGIYAILMAFAWFLAYKCDRPLALPARQAQDEVHGLCVSAARLSSMVDLRSLACLRTGRSTSPPPFTVT